MKTLKKPWGREIWIAQCRHYLGKILLLNKGHRLSLQFHRYKHETIYCDRGRCVVYINSARRVLTPGKSLVIGPRTKHRITAPYGPIKLFEVSTNHPDDVVRLSDDYGRNA
jgi:mannose-6-phosphate isomerase